MAAVEVNTSSTSSTPDIDGHVNNATEYLLLRNFKKCHSECLKGVALAKQFPENDRVQESTEQLCVLCIQALAEMNKWQEVLPLVQNIYSNIEACPHTVIKLCILLHAKVEEYAQCHAIASIWLRCKDNSIRTGYAEVASLYIEHVVMPQGQVLLVPQFLDSCTVLDTNVKHDLIDKFNKLSQDKHDNQTLIETNVEDNQKNNFPPDGDSEEQDIFATVISHVKSMAVLVASKLSYPSLDLLVKIAVAAVGILLLLKVTVTGDHLTIVGHVTVIWQGFLRTLKSAFTPYRKGR